MQLSWRAVGARSARPFGGLGRQAPALTSLRTPSAAAASGVAAPAPEQQQQQQQQRAGQLDGLTQRAVKLEQPVVRQIEAATEAAQPHNENGVGKLQQVGAGEGAAGGGGGGKQRQQRRRRKGVQNKSTSLMPPKQESGEKQQQQRVERQPLSPSKEPQARAVAPSDPPKSNAQNPAKPKPAQKAAAAMSAPAQPQLPPAPVAGAKPKVQRRQEKGKGQRRAQPAAERTKDIKAAAPAAPTTQAAALIAAGAAAVAARAAQRQQQAEQFKAQELKEQEEKAREQKGQKRLQIPPKEEDARRWYASAVDAAELSHRRAGGSASTRTTFGQAVCSLLQEALDERLSKFGFELRSFPPLGPLDLQQPAPATAASASTNTSTPSSSSSSSQNVSNRAEELGSPNGAGKAGRAPTGGNEGAQGLTSASPCIAATFAQWAQAEEELPVLASQRHSVASPWELGASERQLRLLHESHAAHAVMHHAEEHAQIMIGAYEEFLRDVAGLQVVAGRRSALGTLRGAASSYTLAAWVGDGSALEVGCAHFLADNYSRARGVALPYPNPHSNRGEGEGEGEYHPEGEGEGEYLSHMGSGLLPPVLGGLALEHGDDKGLRLPPALAPLQVVIVPIAKSGCDKAALAKEAERIREVLEQAGVRVGVDARTCQPGVRFGASERRGVPLRIEVGPSDLEGRTCTIAQRQDPTPSGKVRGVSTEAGALAPLVLGMLSDLQADMRWAAQCGGLENNIVDVTSFIELRDVIEAGKWARGPWAGSAEDEGEVLREAGASLLCIPLQQPTRMQSGYHTCLYSGYQAAEVAIFARAQSAAPGVGTA